MRKCCKLLSGDLNSPKKYIKLPCNARPTCVTSYRNDSAYPSRRPANPIGVRAKFRWEVFRPDYVTVLNLDLTPIDSATPRRRRSQACMASATPLSPQKLSIKSAPSARPVCASSYVNHSNSINFAAALASAKSHPIPTANQSTR